VALDDGLASPLPGASNEDESVRHSKLTPRELQVLKLLGEGETVKLCASILDLSVKTIEAHKYNMMQKLDIHNRANLTIYAIEHKLVKLKHAQIGAAINSIRKLKNATVEPSKSNEAAPPTEANPK
jgi:DNA-binding CsgD family transcriptional regulator